MGYATWIFQKRTCSNYGSQLMASRCRIFKICSGFQPRMVSPKQPQPTAEQGGSSRPGCIYSTQPSSTSDLCAGAPCWAAKPCSSCAALEALPTQPSSFRLSVHRCDSCRFSLPTPAPSLLYLSQVLFPINCLHV